MQLLSDIYKNYKEATLWLIAGGSPCQGFSSANPRCLGLDDHRSQLIWTIPSATGTIARWVQRDGTDVDVHKIFENVVPKSPKHRQLMCNIFQSAPNLLDNSKFTGMARPRNWHLSFEIECPPTINIDTASFLKPGWRPLWELIHETTRTHRFGTRLRSCEPGQPREFPAPWRRFPLSMYGLNHLVYRPDAPEEALADLRSRVQRGIIEAPSNDLRPPNLKQESVDRRGEFAEWIELQGGGGVARGLDIEEVERAMGWPSTALPEDDRLDDKSEAVWKRHDIIGNAFAIPPILHILEHLSGYFGGQRKTPPKRDLTTLPASLEEIAALDPGKSQVVSLPGNGDR